MSAITVQDELREAFKLTAGQVDSFRTEGFIKLKDVLSAGTIERYGREITRKVVELNTLTIPMKERDTYQKAFLQVMNLWRRSETVKELVFSPRLARIAAELLGVPGVRLYHDQALYKEAGGGFTPWHTDQYYWPLATEKTVTAWIPLQATPLEMGPLAFSARSQNFLPGRELAISDESEVKIAEALEKQDFEYVEEPFDLGEVSYHYGWTFHRAGPNAGSDPRNVMTVIYMDADMRLKQPANDNQQKDWDAWCPGAKTGEIIDTPLNPVMWREQPIRPT